MLSVGVDELKLVGGLVYALILIAAAGIAAYRLAWSFVGHRDIALRLAGTLVVGCWLATLCFHLLQAFGLFHPLTGSVMALLITFMSKRFLHGTSTRQLLRRDMRVLRKLTSGWRCSPWTLAFLFFVPFIVLRAARALFLPAIAWDTLAYHGPRAAIFLEGAFTFDAAPGTWNMYRNFFAGGEVLWAWAMLPFHSDMLANLASTVQWLGVGVATWAFGRSIRLKEPFAALSGILVLFIPTLQLEIPSGYVEPPLYLAMMVSLASAIHVLRRPSAGLVLVGAMAAGVAIGIKLTGALPAAIACVFMWWRLSGCRHLPRWHAAVAFSLVAAILPSLPWIVHAWFETGAPLSPIPVRIFGLTLGKAAPHLAWHIQYEMGDAYTWAAELAALKKMFPLPGSATEGLGLLSLIPIALAGLGLLRVFLRSRATGLLILVSLIVIVVCLYLPGLSMSRLHQSANVSRFLIGIVLICIPLSLRGLIRWKSLARYAAVMLWCCFAFYAVFFVFFGWAPHERHQIGLGLIAAVLLLAVLVLLTRRTTLLRYLIAFGVVWLAVIDLRHSQLRYRYDAARDSTQLHWLQRYWVEGARVIDDHDISHEIAVTSGPSRLAAYWYTYFFFGSELQNRLHYVPVTVDGKIAHFGPNNQRRRLADRDAWLRRLAERNITHIVAFKPNSVERDWIRQLPGRFEMLHGAEDWGVFRFRTP